MMTQRELAEKMLTWGDLQAQANALAAEIQAAVLDVGKTQTVGTVRVTYSQPRKGYDYKTFAVVHPPAVVKPYTETVTTTSIDWRSLYTDVDIYYPGVVPENATPSVTIKLLD